MKTNVPFKQRVLKTVMLLTASAFSVLAAAQYSSELRFVNDSLYSGSAGADNAVYRFRDVNSTMDAFVTIKGRSSNAVSLTNIDVSSTGFAKAFQPQISRTNVNGITSYWMEFEIRFVEKGTTQSANITEAFATALDIDGNGSTLREWDAFYGAASYTLETGSLLTVNPVTGILGQLNLLGRQFVGTLTDHAGIDTTATQLMTTNRYLNTNTINIRLGGNTTGNTNNINRQYSIWFKDFTYTAPVSTLPVKLASFTATLNNNKADLKWTTATEINASHFVVERSLDGRNFTDVGMVFAMGNSTDAVNYNFADNLSHVTVPVVYYRLRSVDIDARTEYSDTRIIRLAKLKENTVSILTYPNPVSNELRITVPSSWQNKPVVYEMYAVNGQVARRIQSASSGQTETLNVSTLAPGVYVVKVTCEGTVAQQRIVKQ